MDTNSKATGDTTEAYCLSTLLASGYSVSIPFGDNDKYDLIVDTGSRLLRVQCKTAWQGASGTIRFNTHSQTTTDGDYEETTYEDAIDAFLAHYPRAATCSGSTSRMRHNKRCISGTTPRSTTPRSTGWTTTATRGESPDRQPALGYCRLGQTTRQPSGHAASSDWVVKILVCSNVSVFGLLALGMATYALQFTTKPGHWNPTNLRRSFWLLNAGLAWMVFVGDTPLLLPTRDRLHRGVRCRPQPGVLQPGSRPAPPLGAPPGGRTHHPRRRPLRHRRPQETLRPTRRTHHNHRRHHHLSTHLRRRHGH